MSVKERAVADEIVKKNDSDTESIKKQSARVAAFLSYYLIRMEDIPVASEKEKAVYIADFEASCTSEVSDMCRELLAKC